MPISHIAQVMCHSLQEHVCMGLIGTAVYLRSSLHIYFRPKARSFQVSFYTNFRESLGWWHGINTERHLRYWCGIYRAQWDRERYLLMPPTLISSWSSGTHQPRQSIVLVQPPCCRHHHCLLRHGGGTPRHTLLAWGCPTHLEPLMERKP